MIIAVLHRIRSWLWLPALCCLVALATGNGAQQASPRTPSESSSADEAWSRPANPIVVFETSRGAIKIELFRADAPLTVENFLRYVDAGYYSDTVFHRVISGFVIQGGGFTPELEPKPTLPPVRIETKNGLTNERGTLAMARTAGKDSATSQFFINLSANEQLNRSAHSFGYTVFGRVIEGMSVVDAISRVQVSRRGPMENIPIIPVFLNSARREDP